MLQQSQHNTLWNLFNGFKDEKCVGHRLNGVNMYLLWVGRAVDWCGSNFLADGHIETKCDCPSVP